MCFTVDLPMDEAAESGWNPNPRRENHKYFPFLFCNEAGFVMFGDGPNSLHWVQLLAASFSVC